MRLTVAFGCIVIPVAATAKVSNVRSSLVVRAPVVNNSRRLLRLAGQRRCSEPQMNRSSTHTYPSDLRKDAYSQLDERTPGPSAVSPEGCFCRQDHVHQNRESEPGRGYPILAKDVGIIWRLDLRSHGRPNFPLPDVPLERRPAIPVHSAWCARYVFL